MKITEDTKVLVTILAAGLRAVVMAIAQHSADSIKGSCDFENYDAVIENECLTEDQVWNYIKDEEEPKA